MFYRQTTDPSLLARTTSEIRAAFPTSSNVTIINLLIATWSRVGYYLRNTDKVHKYKRDHHVAALNNSFVTYNSYLCVLMI